MVDSGERTSLWRLPALRALVWATSLGFASYGLTLASLPAYAVAGGAGVRTAGLVTTVFLLATIAVQMAVPRLTARFGLGAVFAAGLLALGAPAPLYALGDGLGRLAAISVVRGAGFAVLTVLSSTLAALVAPTERRGESLGLYGLAIAGPNLLAVPAGAALVLHGHVAAMAWLAALPVLALPLVPGLVRAVPPGAGRPSAGSSTGAVRGALLPAVVLFAVTFAGGATVTFLPIERPDGVLATVALLLYGIASAVGRWCAGLLGDRIGNRLLLPATVLLTAVGLAVLATGLAAGAPVVLGAGAAVLGAGYGAVQSLTLMAAFDRAGDGGATTASAFWNAAFDAGTGVGAVALGPVAASIGLPWGLTLVAVLLAALLPVSRLATRPRLR